MTPDEQAARKRHYSELNHWECPNCDNLITQSPTYCSRCGRDTRLMLHPETGAAHPYADNCRVEKCGYYTPWLNRAAIQPDARATLSPDADCTICGGSGWIVYDSANQDECSCVRRAAIQPDALVAQLTEAIRVWSTSRCAHYGNDPYCNGLRNALAAADAQKPAAANQWETFPIDGHVQKNDGSDWTPEESEAFFDDFLAWIESRNLGFGGGLGHSDALA